MRKSKVIASFIKIKLFHSLCQPIFCVPAILFNFLVCANYFFLQKFFIQSTTDLQNFFYSIPLVSIIIIPILAFKTEDEKFDELLPMSTVEKIFARCGVAFSKFVLIVLPLAVVPICVNFFGDIDAGQTFTGFTVIILYGATATSLAVFFNFLFSNNVIAIIATAAILSLFYFSNNFFLATSFTYRFDAAAKGILDSRDVMFHIASSVTLIFLAVYFSEKQKEKKYYRQQQITIFFISAILILIFFDSSKFYLRKDFTKDKKFSISEYSHSLLSQIDEPVHVTYFKSKNISNQYSGMKDIEYYLSLWCATNKNISLEVIDASSVNQSLLIESGIIGQQVRTETASSTNLQTVYSGISIEYGGNIYSIPFIINAETLEYELALRINKNQEKDVMIICANGMSLEKDYSYVIPYLSANGFFCTVANVNTENFYDRVMSFDGTIIVLGTYNFSDAATAAIEQFVLRGGNVFFAVSPYFVNIAEDWSATKETSPILDLLERWGIMFADALVADESSENIYLVGERENETQFIKYPYWVSVLPQESARKGLSLFWASPILHNDGNSNKTATGNNSNSTGITSLIFSSKNSVAVNESKGGMLFDTNPFTASQLDIANESYDASDSKSGRYILAVEKTSGFKNFYTTVTQQEKSHIIVVADQLFCASRAVEYINKNTEGFRNLDFLLESVLRLSGEAELAQLHNKSASSSGFYKLQNIEAFASATRKTLFLSFIFVPTIYIALAIFLRVLKKHHAAKLTGKIK